MYDDLFSPVSACIIRFVMPPLRSNRRHYVFLGCPYVRPIFVLALSQEPIDGFLHVSADPLIYPKVSGNLKLLGVLMMFLFLQIALLEQTHYLINTIGRGLV